MTKSGIREVTGISLTKEEAMNIESIARRDGVSFDEAAARLISQSIARGTKRLTGMTPAKVYPSGVKH